MFIKVWCILHSYMVTWLHPSPLLPTPTAPVRPVIRETNLWSNQLSQKQHTPIPPWSIFFTVDFQMPRPTTTHMQTALMHAKAIEMKTSPCQNNWPELIKEIWVPDFTIQSRESSNLWHAERLFAWAQPNGFLFQRRHSSSKQCVLSISLFTCVRWQMHIFWQTPPIREANWPMFQSTNSGANW